MLARKLIAPTAAGSSWSPLDIGSDLLAWYDAQDSGSITETSGAVSQWNDLSGNGNHLTQSTSGKYPTYGATSFNSSYPGIYFDGGDALVRNNFTGTSADVLCAWAVCQMDSGCAAYGRGISYAPNTDNDIGATGSALILRDNSNNNVQGFRLTAKSTKAVTTGAPMVVGSVYDGTNHTIYVNNSAGTPVATTGNYLNSTVQLGVGEARNITDRWTGYFCEIVIFKVAPTSFQTDLDDYLTQRWGL